MIKSLIKSINQEEWWFIIILTVVIILMTTLPYLYGWWQTPPNHTYTNLHSLTPGDMHVYYSYMEQVRQGHFVSEDLYTSEPQNRILLNSFWSVEGLIAKLTGLSNYLVFQLTRIALIPLFTFILYLVSSFIWTDKTWRKINFIFLCFASGLGVLLTSLPNLGIYRHGWYNWPLDLWAPESNNLLIMFQSPHLIASSCLFIAILFLLFISFEKNKLTYSLTAGFLGLLLFQFHPFHTPTIFGVLAIYILVQIILNINKLKTKKEELFNYLKHSLIFTLVSLPSIAYWLLLQRYDFITQIRTYQNVCLTPSWWVTIFSYGFIFILAIFAIYKIVKNKKISQLKLFLIVWFIVQFLMVYSPFPFQRRTMQGLQIPMIILAVIGLHFIYNYLKKKLSPRKFNFYVKNKYLLIILFILIFTPSHIYNWIREIAVFTEIYPQLYIPNDLADSYEWIKNNTSQGSVFLADLYSGNLIPGRAGRKVYVGHAVESLFFDSKTVNMVWFYSTNRLDDKKKKFLLDNNIDYVFYSTNEKGFGDFHPEEKDYLDKVFEQGEAEIYRVIK
jgi:hypothetical protein